MDEKIFLKPSRHWPQTSILAMVVEWQVKHSYDYGWYAGVALGREIVSEDLCVMLCACCSSFGAQNAHILPKPRTLLRTLPELQHTLARNSFVNISSAQLILLKKTKWLEYVRIWTTPFDLQLSSFIKAEENNQSLCEGTGKSSDEFESALKLDKYKSNLVSIYQSHKKRLLLSCK